MSYICITYINDIERLFRTHYLTLHRLASVLLQDDETARDIVNDLFTALLKSPQDKAPKPGYLYSAVRNRCMNLLRDTDLRSRVIKLYFQENEDYDTEEWPDDATVERIYGIIGSDLNSQCRRIMELRFCDGLTFAKVAERMNMSETAVYKYVRQALVIIRKKLSENG